MSDEPDRRSDYIHKAADKLGLAGEEREAFIREAERLDRYSHDMAQESNEADDEACEAEDEWHAACLRLSAANRIYDEAFERFWAFLKSGKTTGVA
jgi:hypothetical protein